MTSTRPSRPARPTRRPSRLGLAVAVLAGVTVVGVLSSVAPTSAATSRSPVLPSASPSAPPLGVADGAIPAGLTVFDDGVPAVANLDPDLLDALRRAATDARAADGIEFRVNGGWRSRRYQAHLLRDAVASYGSEEEAARWVATPDTSPHVSGQAVDLGPAEARAWLSAHGTSYGLCQIYRNEPWHYELRPSAVEHGCPAMYADPTHDPRMQR